TQHAVHPPYGPLVLVRRVPLFVDGGGFLDVAFFRSVPRRSCGLLDNVRYRRGRFLVAETAEHSSCQAFHPPAGFSDIAAKTALDSFRANLRLPAHRARRKALDSRDVEALVDSPLCVFVAVEQVPA